MVTLKCFRIHYFTHPYLTEPLLAIIFEETKEAAAEAFDKECPWAIWLYVHEVQMEKGKVVI